ncbi:MAG: phosphopantothenoylcysteine decarboxylase [Planctomycetes bacterium]|nr:phosphopantothenoylcysteine decarboxylase [Planctomycetota bacterium]
MRILVTSGPTREHIDDVRYISNASSGRMGCCLAEAARRRGHKVTFISGPVDVKPPRGVKNVNVISARDMLKQTLKHFKNCDCLIMAAAVSDYMPALKIKGKMKKGKTAMALRLVKTPDILAEVARTKKKYQVVIGFALEADFNMDYAVDKLNKKKLDMVVLNTVKAIGADKSSAWIITGDRLKVKGDRLNGRRAVDEGGKMKNEEGRTAGEEGKMKNEKWKMKDETKGDRMSGCKDSAMKLNNVSKRRIADVILANAERIFYNKMNVY